MKVTKRQFLKVGVKGSAALFLGSFLRPETLLASPLVVPAGYLETLTHSRWMKLSYSRGRESRQTRRCLGAALRNIGAIKGQGNGSRFAPWFDQGIEATYRRALASRTMPGSVFGLVQMLYDEYFYPRLGPASGRVIFGTLLGILRGRDGTTQGEAAHESYLAYRRASLEYKNGYKTVGNPQEILELRKRRQASLALWQQHLTGLMNAYAFRRARLHPGFVIGSEMIEGFDLYIDPASTPPPTQPRLTFTREGGRLIVAWTGGGTLQQAPEVTGPWHDVANASPTAVDLTERRAFFRAVKR